MQAYIHKQTTRYLPYNAIKRIMKALPNQIWANRLHFLSQRLKYCFHISFKCLHDEISHFFLFYQLPTHTKSLIPERKLLCLWCNSSCFTKLRWLSCWFPKPWCSQHCSRDLSTAVLGHNSRALYSWCWVPGEVRSKQRWKKGVLRLLANIL